MGNPRGVQRDFEALESRRLEAAKLLKAGWSQADVAREVGVHRQSVSRWAAALAKAGAAALKASGGRGRKARLTPADLSKIEDALQRGPEALGYETGLWTLPRVAELIERECGVHYHPGHVWKILRRLKWSALGGRHVGSDHAGSADCAGLPHATAPGAPAPSRSWFASGTKRGDKNLHRGAFHGVGMEWYESGALKKQTLHELGITLESDEWDEAGGLVSSYRLTEDHPNYRHLLWSRKMERRLEQK
jgi:transposase